MAGRVYVNNQKAYKAGQQTSSDAEIYIKKALDYVSRGGTKLFHALNTFGISPSGLTALDVGASTGGFTDCLIQNKAAKVYALDVGHGQIDYRLRLDRRIHLMEKINAHYPFDIPESVDMAVVDVSFISVTKIIPNIKEHLKSNAPIISLIKPQFEAHKNEIGKKGIIKDPLIHSKVLGRISKWAVEHKIRIRNIISSPIYGNAGNKEFFMLLYYD
jgi:23S rRNA (cytidine1920-2'-O)/16S rRNA (cytidine1409-2'-O)-methyltransferase